jgi:hypothetical protein
MQEFQGWCSHGGEELLSAAGVTVVELPDLQQQVCEVDSYLNDET